MAHPAIVANTKTREKVKNGAGPFIKESTEGEGRIWRKKVSLEKRVEERMRSRAKSKRKRIPDSRSSMKKRSTRLNKFDGRNNKKMLIRRAKYTSRNVRSEKMVNIRRLMIMKYFESN